MATKICKHYYGGSCLHNGGIVQNGSNSLMGCPYKGEEGFPSPLMQKKHCERYKEETAEMETIMTKRGVTKKELIELLKPFPDDAEVVVECCNVRAMCYCKDDNTIRID